MCAISPKGEARTFELRGPSVPYIEEVILPLVMVILGFLTIPWLGPKDTKPRAPSVQKAKLGHLNHVCNQFLKYLGRYPPGLGSTILLG